MANRYGIILKNGDEIIPHKDGLTYDEAYDFYTENIELLQKIDANYDMEIVCTQHSAEAFYTGGGIWLSAMYVDGFHYYTIDNDTDYEYLTLYDHRGEDDDIEYSTQNMLWSKSYDDLSPDEMDIFWELKDELTKTMR